MRREGIACKDAGWCPTRKPEGISRRHREAAIFLAGSRGRQGAAASPLARSRVQEWQRSGEREVNGTDNGAAYSPHPNPLPKGARGLERCGLLPSP